MGIAIFFLLAVIVTGVIAYPLLPGQTPAQPAPAVTDGDIEKAVQNLRRARGKHSLFCPACGQGYREGDRFCVRCGSALPEAQVAAAGLTCPSCGAIMREDDRFCAKCGHSRTSKEAA